MDEVQDRRAHRAPEDEARAMAEAQQADERAKIRTWGSVAMGGAGLAIALFAAMIQENATLAGIGFTAAAVGFGIIAAQQAGIFK